MNTTAEVRKINVTTKSCSAVNHKSMTDSQLWTELQQHIDASAESLRAAAACAGELKRRGCDLGRLDKTLRLTLCRIDEGTLMPQVAMKFFNQPTIMNAIAALPIKQQAAIVKNPVVTVFRQSKTGENEVQVPVVKLSRSEVDQVFGGGKVRTIAQQAKVLQPDTPEKEQPNKYISIPLSVTEYQAISKIAADDDIALCEVFRRAARSKGWI
jgi:hypothetical protein